MVRIYQACTVIVLLVPNVAGGLGIFATHPLHESLGIIDYHRVASISTYNTPENKQLDPTKVMVETSNSESSKLAGENPVFR